MFAVKHIHVTSKKGVLFLSRFHRYARARRCHRDENAFRISEKTAETTDLLQFSDDWHIDGLVQDYSNSSALAIELLQSCTKPPYRWTWVKDTLLWNR